jgi:GxxExxY protein
MHQPLKYASLTEQIIGCAMSVHRFLGGGNFTETIYQRALIKELKDVGINLKSELEMPVFYKGDLIGKKRLDIVVEDKVLIEAKALSQFENIHYNQIINYLKIFKIEVGLLINFGSASLQFKRFVKSEI